MTPRPPLWQPTRRAWLAGSTLVAGVGALLARSSGSAPVFAPSSETHAFSVRIEPTAKGVPVNRRVLGSNIDWVYRGDGMVADDGTFAPDLLEAARRLGPTILRYPGGVFADVFRWEAPTNEHTLSRQVMPTLMDTQRFLELCEALGAEPLITVNTVTGSPEEAARWVAATNVPGMTSRRTGRKLQRVKFWEIGNEPYLKVGSRTDIDLNPDEFGRRANRFIRAMRALDPDIAIGLPLTTDARGGTPVTPYPGFTRQVLGIVTERFDYASLHDAYMPMGTGHSMDPAALYWGAAAGALTVRADLDAMTRLLAELRPEQKLPLAITEYSAFFSYGRGLSDRWITSPAGAIYLADVLRVFAETPALLLAAHWSLLDNWLFGAIHAKGYPRPAYQVLRLMGEALEGERIAATVRSDTMRVREIGQVASADAMPLLEVLATRSIGPVATRRTVRLWLINKDPQRAAIGHVDLGVPLPAQARMSLLSDTRLFEASDGPGVFSRSESTLDFGKSQSLRMPPHSVALVTIELASS